MSRGGRVEVSTVSVCLFCFSEFSQCMYVVHACTCSCFIFILHVHVHYTRVHVCGFSHACAYCFSYKLRRELGGSVCNKCNLTYMYMYMYNTLFSVLSNVHAHVYIYMQCTCVCTHIVIVLT